MKLKHKWVLETPAMLIGKDDSRREDFAKYKDRHGFSPDELWSLDHTILCFVLPRLKEFRKVAGGYPARLGSLDEWHGILDTMIDGITLAIEEGDGARLLMDDEKELKDRGIELFLEYFNAL